MMYLFQRGVVFLALVILCLVQNPKSVQAASSTEEERVLESTVYPSTTDVPTSTISPDDKMETVAPTSAPLDDNTMYSVNYRGRFQQVLSSTCTASSPYIVLICKGNIQLYETSDSTIECYSESITLVDGRNAIVCENTCANTGSCKDVYQSSSFSWGKISSTSSFGQISFECSGSNVDDVDSTMIVPKNEDGVCENDNNTNGIEVDENGFNLYLAQLAVNCPSNDGDSSYVIDYDHSECGVENTAFTMEDGTYTCSTGRACGGDTTDTCHVTFEELVVNADSLKFQDCIIESSLTTGSSGSEKRRQTLLRRG